MVDVMTSSLLITSQAHVKGLSALHPLIPEKLRGTFTALCHGPVISHLKQLGVTAIELLPVHFHVMTSSFVMTRLITLFRLLNAVSLRKV
jgi:hypothetical protein